MQLLILTDFMASGYSCTATLLLQPRAKGTASGTCLKQKQSYSEGEENGFRTRKTVNSE